MGNITRAERERRALLRQAEQQQKGEGEAMQATENDVKVEAKYMDQNMAISVTGRQAEEKLNAQKQYDNMPVTGRFINQRAPGQPVRLTYHKYATDPVNWYDFKHNQVYTIPRGFADQINEHYAKLRYEQKTGPVDPSKSVLEDVPSREQIYAFVPVSF